jgi:hypothetical protein
MGIIKDVKFKCSPHKPVELIEESEDSGGVFVIWSRKQLVGPKMAPDVVNPRMLELEVAEEILSEAIRYQDS